LLDVWLLLSAHDSKFVIILTQLE